MTIEFGEIVLYQTLDGAYREATVYELDGRTVTVVDTNSGDYHQCDIGEVYVLVPVTGVTY